MTQNEIENDYKYLFENINKSISCKENKEYIINNLSAYVEFYSKNKSKIYVRFFIINSEFSRGRFHNTSCPAIYLSNACSNKISNCKYFLFDQPYEKHNYFLVML